MQGTMKHGDHKADCLSSLSRLLAYLQKQDAQDRHVGPWQPVLPRPHGYCEATRVAE